MSTTGTEQGCRAAVNIRGEHAPCDLHLGSQTGWLHANAEHELIWCGEVGVSGADEQQDELAPQLFAVIHEVAIGDRTDYGVASGLWLKPPENHLAYCRARQAAGEFADNEGRYFIARVTEVRDD